MKKYKVDLEAKLGEKDKLLNQYPYKNDVIEKQYNELKQSIKYLLTVEDKIKSSFIYSLHNSIDVLCEKHKARIRDIENQICDIDKLEKELAEKEKEIDNLYNRLSSKQKFYEMSLEKDYKEYLSRLDKLEKQCDKEKISFAVEKLVGVQKYIDDNAVYIEEESFGREIKDFIDQQIEELKKEKK